MEKDIQISKLESTLVNLCTPMLYGAESVNGVTFQEIVDFKEDCYKRLVRHLENEGKIPFRVQKEYHKTICGNMAVATAYGRKFYKSIFG